MNKLLSTVAFVGVILLAMPVSACGTIQKVWTGFNAAAWAGTSTSTVWVFCSDGTAAFSSVGGVATESGIQNILSEALFAKVLGCPVILSIIGPATGGLAGIECD